MFRSIPPLLPRLRTLSSVALGLLATGCPQLLADEFDVAPLSSGSGGDPSGDRNTGGTPPSPPCNTTPCAEAGAPPAVGNVTGTSGGTGGTSPNVMDGGASSTEGGTGGVSGDPAGGEGTTSGAAGTPTNGGAGGAGGTPAANGGGSGGTPAVPVVDAGLEPMDECPDHPEQLLAATCGCGVDPTNDCAALEEYLLHRYAFDGGDEQTLIGDFVGNAHGEAIDVTQTGEGTLALDGDDQYATLPDGLLAGLQNATFEVWLEWNGGDDWQRVFDFGNRNSQTGEQDDQTYFYLSPEGYDASGADSVPRGVVVSYTSAGPDEEHRIGTGVRLSEGELSHIAVVLNDTNDLLSIYIDGVLTITEAFDGTLTVIEDINNYLGRSLYSRDPYFDGTLYEIRIHGAALSAADIVTSFELGPDPAFFAD